MNEDKPFQPLRIPAAVIISAFTVIALTEIYGLDTESTSFDLPAVSTIKATFQESLLPCGYCLASCADPP